MLIIDMIRMQVRSDAYKGDNVRNKCVCDVADTCNVCISAFSRLDLSIDLAKQIIVLIITEVIDGTGRWGR